MAPTSAPSVILGTHELSLGGEHLEEMRAASALLHQEDPAALRAQLARDGYLLIRNLLPRESLLRAQRTIIDGLRVRGWPLRACGDGHVVEEHAGWTHRTAASVGALRPEDLEWGQELMHRPEVLAVLEGPELRGFFEGLFGEEPVSLYRKWLRTAASGAATNFHVDNPFFSRGSPALTACWIPLAPCDLSQGGLALLAGSNHLPGFARVRREYGHAFASGLHSKEATKPALDATQLFKDPLELSALDRGARWVTTNYDLGDVVVFPMLTFHGTLTSSNASGRLRLSADCRFQPESRLMDPRYSPTRLVDPASQARLAKRSTPPPTRTVARARADWGLVPRAAL